MVEEQSSPETCGGVDREKPSSHKHVPHREKPPQLVARRNARERRRVQAVNSAFCRLRRAVPIDGHRGKRVSKVKTLRKAIEYIEQLQLLLQAAGQTHEQMSDRNKENSAEVTNRWTSFDMIYRIGSQQTESFEEFFEDFEDEF